MIEISKKAYLKKTNSFKKIFIELIYPYKREENWTIHASLLIRMLLKKTNEYNDEEAFSNALIKNYIMSFQISKYNMGNNSIFKIHIAIPDNKILKDKEFNYQKTFSFFLKAIYDPLTINGFFDKKELDKAKKELKNDIDKSLNNITSYTSIKLDEIIDDEKYFTDSIFNHYNEIDQLTVEDLYNFYNEVIKTKQPAVFILGNVDKQFGEDLMNLFPNNLTANYFDTNYFKSFKKINKLKKIEESKNYSQSIVKFAYKVKNYSQEDTVILPFINSLLNSQSSNILHEYLRTKENLVYTASSNYYYNYGVLIITAKISSDKKAKTIETIYKIMNKMQDEKFINKHLENIIERRRINLEIEKDIMSSVLNNFLDTTLKYAKSSNEEYKSIKNIKPKEITKFIKRLELDTIYYLEGTNNEQ